jgi:hypothetical protein
MLFEEPIISDVIQCSCQPLAIVLPPPELKENIFHVLPMTSDRGSTISF